MKSYNSLITIITPSYNRANDLRNLYDSLTRQTVLNFTWFIVDDGSTDDTIEVVSSFGKNLFEIVFFVQENSGKHRAINNVIDQVKSELVFIVDSDDLLTSDAIETIIFDWSNSEEELIGLTYLRKDTRGFVIGDEFTSNKLISNHSVERIINNVKGDKAEVWKTLEFKRIPFLEFDNEIFFSEQHKYLALSDRGKMMFINSPIYICEYLDGGLSSRIRLLQFENPSGTLANAVPLTNKVYSINIRFKAFLKIYAFSQISGIRFFTVFRDCDYELHWLLLSPIGLLYKHYLSIKYILYKFSNSLL
jgi:glycosyltransferase involved in cell wall biosynthesis